MCFSPAMFFRMKACVRFSETIIMFHVMTGPAFAEQFGDLIYQVEGETVKITACSPTAAGEVMIPAEIEGMPVVAIGNSAFLDCNLITGISIPDSVTTMGPRAFYSCDGLTSVTLPPGLTAIPDELLSRCSNLIAANIPAGVTSIGQNAFSFSLLAQVSIPASVTFIDKFAFFQTSISSVTIPPGVESISQGTFSYCVNLTEVNLPDGLLEVGESGFSSCPSLQSLEMPDSVSTLGVGTFAHCSALKNFGFPPNVTSIPTLFFLDCQEVTSVLIPAQITNLGISVFSGCSKLKFLHFLGSAPTTASNTFSPISGAYPAVYFHGTNNGFTTPTWKGRPSTRLGPPTPSTTWLIANSLTPDTPLTSDPNSDGVSLLMAYALALNPHENLAGRMPVAVATEDGLSMSFHGAAEGVSYRVEACTDLSNWSVEGVRLSEPNPEGQRTATINSGATDVFLRLRVSD